MALNRYRVTLERIMLSMKYSYVVTFLYQNLKGPDDGL
jgi:hypothetical protein